MKMTRLFAGALLSVVPLVAAPVSQASAVSDAPQAAVQGAPAVVVQSSAAYSRTILVKVNELRAGLGLKPVTRYVQLDSIAQELVPADGIEELDVASATVLQQIPARVEHGLGEPRHARRLRGR